jgi:hypothetical protein
MTDDIITRLTLGGTVRIDFDIEAGAGYMYLHSRKHDTQPDGRRGISARSVPIDPDVVLDFDAAGRLIGIEFLSLAVMPEDLATAITERRGLDQVGKEAGHA